MSKQSNYIKPTPPVRAEALAQPQSSIVNRQSSIVNHLIALGLYFALTLLFAWPVLQHLSEGTPGNFQVDRYQNIWNFWWFRHSLLETFTNPYQTNFLFYPYGVSLYLHTYSPYNQILGLPLQLLFGIIPAYSLLVLSTFILAPYSAYLLTRYLVKDEGAALLGGTVFGFCAYHYYGLFMDQINLVTIQWIPLFILFMLKTDRATTRREILINGGLASFFFLLNLMTEYYYATYLVLFAGLWWLARLVQNKSEVGSIKSELSNKHQVTSIKELQPETKNQRLETKNFLPSNNQQLTTNNSFTDNPSPNSQLATRNSQLTLKLAGIFGLAGLVFSPVLYGTVKAIASGRYKQLENSGAHQVHSADLAELWLPPDYHGLWGERSGLWASSALNPAGTVISYVGLALAIYALFKVRGLWFWAISGLFWLIVSFGPTLWIANQETGWPMPYRLLAKLPLFNITRAPERFILMVQLSLAVLAAYGMARLTQKMGNWQRWSLVGLGIALFYLETTPGFLPAPEKIGSFPFTQTIKADNGQVAPGKAILELPVTKHQNPDSPRMLYQTFHGRPIIGGYISRKLRDPYRENDYALFEFIEPRKDTPDIVPRKTLAEWRGLLNYANMGYIVLYPADFGRKEDLTRAQDLISRATANAAPIYQDKQASVYQIGPGRLEKPLIILTQGWNDPETIDAKAGRAQRWLEDVPAKANIVLDSSIPLQDSYSLQLEATAYYKSRRLQIWLNGQQIKEINVPPALDTISIPGLKLKSGDNILELRLNPADGYSVPAEVEKGSTDLRKLRVAILSLAVK